MIYGGVVLEAARQVGDTKKTVFISHTQEKLDDFLYFPTPSCKKDIQSICGAAAQLKRLSAANVPFYWNDDLQAELDRMMVALKEHVKLSPLETSKDLVIWCEAAPSEGMSYIIAQFRDPENESLGPDIVCCDIQEKETEFFPHLKLNWPASTGHLQRRIIY